MHAKGFVHADMKPNNIIVDEKLNARIIDLGQSCKIGTIKQRIQGTPDYIAPEQVHRRAITPKTDVYNLGAALYWILTRAFIPTALSKGDKLLGSVDDALLAKPKKPSEINPRVPDMLDDLIMACVEVDQDKRPTMEQVHDKINFIRSKLIAEAELRKTRGLPRIDPDGGLAPGGSGGSGTGGPGPSGPNGSGGSRGPSEGGPKKPGDNGSSDSNPGQKGPGGSSIFGRFPNLGGSAGCSSGVGVGKPTPRNIMPPPIDPGPGIADADD
jgi:serine/threonine protein kinase